jgi:hypothetical protein
MSSPLIRELIARIDELHPLDRDSLFEALAGVLLARLDGADLWAELRELDGEGECSLARYVINWLSDDDAECDADDVLAAVQRRRAAREGNHAAH